MTPADAKALIDSATEFAKAVSPFLLIVATPLGLLLTARANKIAAEAKQIGETVAKIQQERIAISEDRFKQLDNVDAKVEHLANGGGDAKVDERLATLGIIDRRDPSYTPPVMTAPIPKDEQVQAVTYGRREGDTK